jgi:hypothetical protein
MRGISDEYPLQGYNPNRPKGAKRPRYERRGLRAPRRLRKPREAIVKRWRRNPIWEFRRIIRNVGKALDKLSDMAKKFNTTIAIRPKTYDQRKEENPSELTLVGYDDNTTVNR